MTGAGAGAMAGANNRASLTCNRALLKYDRALLTCIGGALVDAS